MVQLNLNSCDPDASIPQVLEYQACRVTFSSFNVFKQRGTSGSILNAIGEPLGLGLT